MTDPITRDDLARAFDEGYEHGWRRGRMDDTSDPDNPYTKDDDDQD